MTDNEIIKALECCNTEDENGFANCDDCPYYAKGMCLTCPEIFDLINRQQAEISVLRKLLDKAETEMNNQSENMKKLTKDCSSMQSTLAKMSMGVKQAKAEAIKELMFNLDNEISTYSSAGKDLNVYAWLKSYVKERVGDTE